MKTTEELKNIVKEKYGQIVVNSEQSCGCGCSPGSESQDISDISDDYSSLEGYNPDADLKLGCGVPVEHAMIKEGDSVLDLGSGAGNDCFVARAIVGDTGHVTGLDFTEEMIAKAKKNVSKLGFTNVDFVHGDIDNMPFQNNSFDVVISNCVLNLVPDKQKAYDETYRVLKPGGHFSISDIVLEGQLPEKLQKAAEMYVGCVSGALQKEEYLNIIENSGFKDISIKSEKIIQLPDVDLQKYLTPDEISVLKASNTKVISITLSGKK